jgi:GNAT superfamily N-acetyltransferase
MVDLPGWRVERVSITHPDAALLVEEVQQEYVRRYGGRDETPIDPTYFDEPMGAFFVGYLDDRPVATGAWRRRTDVVVGGTWQTAEVKRMYVAPSARRLGLARAMLAHLEETARTAGAGAMVLETGLRQPEAITLYESAGYTRVPGFGYYRDAPLSRCFARSLMIPL